jgi:hypothetical protein
MSSNATENKVSDSGNNGGKSLSVIGKTTIIGGSSTSSTTKTSDAADAAAAATGAAVADKSTLAKQPAMAEVKAVSPDAGQWVKGLDNQTLMLVAGGAILLVILMKKSGAASTQTAFIPMPSSIR